MRDIRFLLDENVNPLFRRELLRREPSLVVWKVGSPGAPPAGSSDQEVLRWCEDNIFVLVTSNRKSMPVHLQHHLDLGGHVPGIIQLDPGSSVGDTIAELLLIWEASETYEYRDLLFYLPLG